MAASRTRKKHTKKKFNPQIYNRAREQAEAEVVTEILARFMNLWSRKQLDLLAQEREFVCMDLGRDIYQVGKYYLERQQEHSWIVRNRYKETVHDFYNRQAAVLYCLFDSRNQIHRAYDFLRQDQELARLSNQMREYNDLLKKASKKQDIFRQDLYIARISWVRPILEEAQINLEKTINGAKYSKA